MTPSMRWRRALATHIRSSLGPGSEVARPIRDALIDLLRANSTRFSRAGNALRDELSRVESYLKLMQIRLGARLAYEITCRPSLAAVGAGGRACARGVRATLRMPLSKQGA